MASTAIRRSLSDVVRSHDLDALTAFIVERYDVLVADCHVADILFDLEMHFDDRFMGEHCLEARLRNRLRDNGYFERMFGEAEMFDVHQTWNALHWPWQQGFADGQEDGDFVRSWLAIDPQYVRSRLPNALIEIQPVNATACKVARPPRESRWKPCLSGETVIERDASGVRLQAYDYAEKHGMKATIRKIDDNKIEVRFTESAK